MGDLPGGAANIVRLFDAAPIAMCHLQGRDLVLDAVNPAGRDVLGLLGTPIGRPARDALRSALGDALHSTLLAVLDDGSERRFLHVPEPPTSDDLPLSRAYDVAVVPDRSPGGRIRGVFLFGRPMRLMGGLGGQSSSGSSGGASAGISAGTSGDTGGAAGGGALSPPDGEAMLALLRTASSPVSTPVTAYGDVVAHVVLPAVRPGIGADWFESHVSSKGILSIAVGDLGTHGLGTSPGVLRLRAVASHRLDAGAGPSETLDALDREARGPDGSPGSAAAVARYTPETGLLEVTSRGFAPMLLVSPSGRVRTVGTLGSAPLGLTGDASTATVLVDHGDVMVVCSDSVVARPGTSVGESLRTLGEALGRHVRGQPTTPSICLTRLGEEVHLLRPTSPRCGALVLAAHLLRHPRASFEDRRSLEPGSSGELNRRLREWLGSVDVGDDQVVAISRAVDEVVTALATQPGAELRLQARVDGAGLFTLTLAATSPEGGSADAALSEVRALLLLLRLVEQVHVSSVVGSTVVVLRTTLSHPTRVEARVEARGEEVADDGEPAQAALATTGGARVLVVTGSVAGPLDHLRDAVLAVLRSAPVRVDVSDVTDPGSEFVVLLDRLAREPDVELVATPGSAAHTAMTLAGLSFRVR